MEAEIEQKIASFIDKMGAPYGLELSFQLRTRRLCAGRRLYSVHKQHLGFRAKRKLLTLAESLQIPDEYALALEAEFDDATIIHLGMDPGASHACKIYLEFPLSQNPSTNELLFRAFKWAPQAGSQHSITEYCIDGQHRASEFSRRLDHYYPDIALANQKLLVSDLLGLVDKSAPALELLALSVSEPGNPRRSFDLNLYDANLTLTDLADWLSNVAQLYELPRDRWETMLAAIQGQSLGHIAGGIDRRGDVFLTVYHGLEGY